MPSDAPRARRKAPAYRLRWLPDLAGVSPEDWDALAKRLETPFLEWAWLRTLELSGSTSPGAGWLPHHLTVWSGRRLVAAAPLYIKSHSAGEFVFDHLWAEVAERLGIAYYPKLVGMSPFTPMIGYRFLMAEDVDEAQVTRLMVGEIDALCERLGLSGASFLFVEPEWGQRIAALGFEPWHHLSFAWTNRGFTNFEDYLALFNANQRRNIRRERRALSGRGIRVAVHTGREIPGGLIPLMYEFYKRTNDKFGPWGCRYLTPAFFEQVGPRFADRLMVVAAYGPGRQPAPLGMSLLVRKGRRLYGRYWGCRQEVPMLHFELCYYTPIEWAIANEIRLFDPGAGGAHKVRRGFAAVANQSLHRFRDPRLQQVMRRHIGRINRLELEQIEALNRRLPFAAGR